jgi:transposase-like protein
MKIGKKVSLEEIIKLYRDQGWTAERIARKVNVWPQTVLRWLRDASVVRRPSGRRSVRVDPKTLEELYYQRRYTLKDIANKYKTSDTTVLAWFRRFGIPRRPRGHLSKREQIR